MATDADEIHRALATELSDYEYWMYTAMNLLFAVTVYATLTIFVAVAVSAIVSYTLPLDLARYLSAAGGILGITMVIQVVLQRKAGTVD